MSGPRTCAYQRSVAPLADLSIVPEDFQDGLARGEVGIALQPLVTLRDGRVARFEALARWQHPVRGQIAPATFIPLAESCGQATALSFHLLRQGCRFHPELG